MLAKFVRWCCRCVVSGDFGSNVEMGRVLKMRQLVARGQRQSKITQKGRAALKPLSGMLLIRSRFIGIAIYRFVSMKREKMDRRTRLLLTELAHNLKHKRAAKGWTQEELAHVSGLHRTYIGAVERGGRNVTLLTLTTLAVSLDTTVVALLGGPANGE
jgi:DNA-binding XRE family transcriptional regulator